MRRAATLLKLIADATRCKVIVDLGDGEKNVGELCTMLKQSQPAVSHHLALLRVSGIIEARRSGKNNYYSSTDLGKSLGETITNLCKKSI